MPVSKTSTSPSVVTMDTPAQQQNTAVSLICLPFAGAGASFFNSWGSLNNTFTIVAPQLPGREKRFLEEPYRDVTQAISGVLAEIKPLIQDTRVIIFGHSLGAVLAFELAYQVLQSKHVEVEYLVVSGSPGPWTPRTDHATGLDDQKFLERVREFAGYDHPALADPELREMLLPTLRADVEMHENYYPPENRRLDIPIMSVRGAHDELVSHEEATQWQSATTLPLRLEEIPGRHMYLTESPEVLLDLMKSLVSSRAMASAATAD
jgi:surfactin synthase thioesterase subunit